MDLDHVIVKSFAGNELAYLNTILSKTKSSSGVPRATQTPDTVTETR